MPAKTSSTNYFSASAISALIYLWCAFGLHSAPAIDSLHIELYLSYNDIQSVYAHVDTLWAGTRHGGIARSIVSDSSFIHYTTSDGLSGNNVHRVIPADSVGAVWAATDNGFSYVTDNYIKSYRAANSVQLGQVYHITVIGKRVAVGCAGGLLVVYNDEEIEFTNRFETNFPPKVEYCKDSTLWVACPLGIYKLENKELFAVDPPAGVEANSINSIAVDTNENLWVVIKNNDIACYDGTDWKIFTVADGDLTHSTDVFRIDPEGNPISVSNQGISKYKDGNWNLIESFYWADVIRDFSMPDTSFLVIATTYQNKPLLYPLRLNPCFWPQRKWLEGNDIEHVAIDKDGTLYVSPDVNQWGIHTFDGTEWSYYSKGTIGQLCDNIMTAYAQDTMGGHWFGHGNGLTYQLNGAWKGYQYINSHKLPYIYDLIVSQNNELWAAFMGGVINYDYTNWIVFDTSHGLPSIHVRAITELNDSTIVAGTSKGIAYKEGERFIPDAETSDWSIRSLEYTDNGYLIAVTSKGVFIKKDQWEKILDERYGNDSETDKDGRIWIPTMAKGVIITDTTGQILQTVKIAEQAAHLNIARGKDGRMWIGTTEGLAAVTIFSSESTTIHRSKNAIEYPKRLHPKVIGVYDLKGRRIGKDGRKHPGRTHFRSASGIYISKDANCKKNIKLK